MIQQIKNSVNYPAYIAFGILFGYSAAIWIGAI